MQVIAEVKTHSPFGWESSRTWEELFHIAESVGDIIAVHTDPRWHGSFDLIETASRLTEKPILAKGIHSRDSDILRAFDAGADSVLVVGRLPAICIENCLIEPNSIEELANLPGDIKAVWNSRDLATGGLKKAVFSEARDAFPGWLCQASNITSVQDIESSADAILVGAFLPEIAAELKK